jgi:hypothetical protein
VLVVALMGPLLLWPIEQVLPWPVAVEEVFKALLVWWLLRRPAQKPVFWVFLAGLAFGISETAFYSINFLMAGEVSGWMWRWVTTVPMHVLTMGFHYAGWRMGVGPLGIVPAMLVHAGFNQGV